MRYVITGASGQFGRLAVAELLKRVMPDALILVTRQPDHLADFKGLGCEVRYGDFDNASGLVAAFSGGARLLLISGTRVGQRIAQHSGAIDAARKAGIRHVFYTSFLAAGDPSNRSEAVKDHRGTEEALRASGLAWTILRNAQYADAVTDVMAHVMVREGVIRSVAGDGCMPFIWREDCVLAAVAALTGEGHEGQTYDLTGPELISYRKVGDLIGEYTRQKVRLELTDEAGLYDLFDSLGVPRNPIDGFVANGNPWNSDDMVSFEVAVRDGRFNVHSEDFRRLTGSEPRTLRALFDARFG